MPPIPSAQCDPHPGSRPHRVAHDSDRPRDPGLPGSPRGPPDPIHVSILDLCRRHSVGRSYVYRLLAEKKIRGVKLGRRVLVNVASADAFFAELPQAEVYVPSLINSATV